MTQSTKETGMMDVGTHCEFCRQLDFLPFYCSGCKLPYCGMHRTKDAHQCVSLKNVTTTVSSSSNNNGVSSQEYFPDRTFKPMLNQVPPSYTLKQKLEQTDTDLLSKIKGFIGSLKSQKSTPASKIVALSKLKKAAQGDDKIPIAERIYVWVRVIDEEFDKGNENQIFISRAWPVGRALDSISRIVGIKNMNNTTSSKTEKLFLYKLRDSVPVPVETGKRVITEIASGDHLFVVRGEYTQN